MSAPDWITLDEGETVEWSGGPVVASALPQLLAAGVVLAASLAFPLVTGLPWVAAGREIAEVHASTSGVAPPIESIAPSSISASSTRTITANSEVIATSP